jgi:predicted nucleotidyltransferase
MISDELRSTILSNINKELNRKLLFVHIGGSHLYGLNTESSDLDIRGVFVADNKSWLGLEVIENYVKHNDDNIDYQLYEIKKFLKLSYVSNPNIIESLYIEKDNPVVLIWTKDWEWIRDMCKKYLVSQLAKTGFIGFATSQIKKLLTKSGNKTGRVDLVENFGFDVKFASHSIRLMYELLELLTTENITFPLKKDTIDLVLSIKNGKKYKKDEVNKFINDFEALADFIHAADYKLRKIPDYKKYVEFYLTVFNNIVQKIDYSWTKE